MTFEKSPLKIFFKQLIETALSVLLP